MLLAGDFPAPELWESPKTHWDPAGATPPAATAAAPAPTQASRSVASPPHNATPAHPPSLQLWLQARDPYCIVVFWNAATDALDRFANARGGGSWRLRVSGGHLPDRRVLDDVLSTSLDHRFVAVPDPGCPYFAEIGFRAADGTWIPAARSAALSTPVAGPSPVPSAPPAARPEHAVAETTTATVPAVLTLPTPPPRSPQRKRSRPQPSPAAIPWEAAPLFGLDPDDPTDLLFALALEDSPFPAFPNSGEWARRSPQEQRESGGNARRADAHPDRTAWAAPGSEGSSEHRLQPEAPAPPPGFWFEINAELIVYGRTERDARVTVGGRPILLRPDGSFRFQFSLPDGEYEMPVVAVNARDDDGRAALLEFARHTETTGDVGTHPQDPSLNPPPAGERASVQ